MIFMTEIIQLSEICLNVLKIYECIKLGTFRKIVRIHIKVSKSITLFE